MPVGVCATEGCVCGKELRAHPGVLSGALEKKPAAGTQPLSLTAFRSSQGTYPDKDCLDYSGKGWSFAHLLCRKQASGPSNSAPSWS